MKQYDKIYVPNKLLQQDTKYVLCQEAVPYPLVGLDEEKDKIVLTLEELREVFDAGISSYLDTIPSTNAFNDLLASKGITLK